MQKFKSLSLGTEKEGNGDAGGDTQRKMREAGLPERLSRRSLLWKIPGPGGHKKHLQVVAHGYNPRALEAVGLL